MALDRGASHALLDRSKIINRDHPTQPATALRRSCTDRLTERRLVSCRMIQNADDLDIMPVRQRQDPVAGAEPWMEPAVEKGHAQLRSEPPRRGLQAFRPGRERQVIQAHSHIVAGGHLRRAGGLFSAA